MSRGMVGRTYLERPVLANWSRGPYSPVVVLARASWKKGSPRNVLIRRPDGSTTIRPFRGLRRPEKVIVRG
jgi:hypothetical protein